MSELDPNLIEVDDHFRQALKDGLVDIPYDPSLTPIFRQMTQTLHQEIEKDKGRGVIYESKVRWDKKDQDDFDRMPIEQLLDDPYYGGGRYYVEQIEDQMREHAGLWPEHRQDIIDLDTARREYGTDTFVDIEGIGSGKTHKFRTILRIEVMRVLTRESPLEYYGLDPDGQGISFVCMSRNANLAKRVTFTTVLKAFDCPFFNTYFPPQVDMAKIRDTQRFPSILQFPKDVVIFPGSGTALSTIGYNLMGGGVDEANYLEVVEGSKKAVIGQDYDAAESMYSAIYARMESRFIRWKNRHSRLPGLLMLFSNPRHSTDFLERLAIKAKYDRRFFVRRRTTWEAQPKDTFSGDTFFFDIVNRRICDKEGVPIDKIRDFRGVRNF